MEEECTGPMGLSSEKSGQHSCLQEGSRGMNVEVAPSNPGLLKDGVESSRSRRSSLVNLFFFLHSPLNWAAFRLFYCAGLL